MIYCSNCGSAEPEDTIFCGSCGSKMEAPATKQTETIQQQAQQQPSPVQQQPMQSTMPINVQQSSIQAAAPPMQQPPIQPVAPPMQQPPIQPITPSMQQPHFQPYSTAKTNKTMPVICFIISFIALSTSIVFGLIRLNIIGSSSGNPREQSNNYTVQDNRDADREPSSQQTGDENNNNDNNRNTPLPTMQAVSDTLPTPEPTDEQESSIASIEYEDTSNFSILANPTTGAAFLRAYSGDSPVVMIPPTVRTRFSDDSPVTGLDRAIFKGNQNITSVVIPRTVVDISMEAFSNCINLVSLYFEGNAPTFGANVFSGTPVENITIFYKEGATGWSNPFVIGEVSISTQTY